MSDDIQLLLEYIDLLEAELRRTDPERLQKLTQNRENLIPLLQTQRALIENLQTAHRDDQAEIARLRADIAALRGEQ